jgi:hypothetical protein
LFSVRITDKYLELVAEETKRQKEYTVAKQTHVTADAKLLTFVTHELKIHIKLIAICKI